MHLLTWSRSNTAELTATQDTVDERQIVKEEMSKQLSRSDEQSGTDDDDDEEEDVETSSEEESDSDDTDQEYVSLLHMIMFSAYLSVSAFYNS